MLRHHLAEGHHHVAQLVAARALDQPELTSLLMVNKVIKRDSLAASVQVALMLNVPDHP